MKNIISLESFVQKAFDRWTTELVKNGRSFPNHLDGLKESTRAIVTATARLADFKGTPVDAERLVGEVPQYKEARTDNVAKNLFRLANANTPLIKVISNDERDSLGGLDRIRGGYSKPGYVSIALTELGKYIFKYRDYFETELSESSSDLLKYKAILTPFPLSLVIPLVNLADGVSNNAPNLNILEVIDAYIEHIENDKKSTTEQLAKHITGYETTKGSKVLFSNQAIYDLIERGVARGVSLSPIKFYKNEMLIEELPFRKFGISIMKEFEKLGSLGQSGNVRGFNSFDVLGINAEQSEESLITINYKIRKGFSIEEVQNEIYTKTSMKDILIYKNICVDLESERPLTIKSVREVLDTHVDLGIKLKSRSIKESIDLLLKEREDAEFLEKVSRKICVDIIGAVIGATKRRELVKTYLNGIYDTVIKYLNKEITFEDLKIQQPHIDRVIIKNFERFEKMSMTEFGNTEPENMKTIIDREVPKEINQSLIGKIFQREYDVLYNLNKRVKAIETLKGFDLKYNQLKESLHIDNIKKDLIMEMKLLRSSYKDSKFSENFYALKEHERMQKVAYKKKLKEEMKNMSKEMPVNVLIDKDYKARISVNPVDKVSGLIKLIECTTEDELVVICKNGNSYKKRVSEISFEGVELGDKGDILSVIVDNSRSNIEPLYLFATNHGRVIIVDRTLTNFYSSKLNIPLRDGENIIYSREIAKHFYNDDICIMLRTSDNKYKKRPLSEFNIKTKLVDFYNMFADNSATDKVIDACIINKSESTTLIWNGNLDAVYCFGGLKRNISMPDKLDYNKSGGKLLDYNLLHKDGDIITNSNLIFNRTGLRTMNKILFDINHEALNNRLSIKNPSEVTVLDTSTSFRRLGLNLNFVPNELQVQAYVQRLGKQ